MRDHHGEADSRLGCDQQEQRRAELLGAAAADDLSPAEHQELDAMCAQDPELAEERRALLGISAVLRRSLGSWREEHFPGALGPLETLRCSGAGIDVDGMLIAHARGTEAVLEVDGLPAGGTFSVALVAADGQKVESDTILSTGGPVECRVNAAVPRDDVERVEIRDHAGLVVLAAELLPAE